MPDKLLNTLKIQSTMSPFNDPSPSKSSGEFNTSNKNLLLYNPQDDNNYLQQNDQLFKIINFDNGNAVKDCKALLDMMKQQFLQEKQKLNLFYQPDLEELLQGLKVNDINVKKTIMKKTGQQIESKIKNIKIKKRNEIFNNYSKLMKYSLSQNERIQFIKQSSKITQVRCPSSQSSNKTNDIRSSQSILQRMMQQKRNKIAIQNSSKMNQQWKQLQGIMKNRTMCEKILQEALMFQRYYHIMKKEKQKVLAQEGNGSGKMMDTGLRWRRVKTQTGIVNNVNKNNLNNLRQSQSFFKRSRQSMHNRNKSQSSSSYKTANTSKKNELCMDPRHLRLPESVEDKSSLFLKKKHMTQQDFYRSKFMVGLKRDEYLRQINKVNEQIVEKKNVRNNCLISNVLGLIRQNTVGNNNKNNQENNDNVISNNKLAVRKRSRSKQQKKQLTNEKIKQLSGSQLTKILRRLFLIYSSNNNNNSKNKKNINDQSSTQQQILITLSTINTQSLSLMSRKSLLQFFNDFQLQQYLQMNNQKIQQILQKDHIDQFQFIQLIHLLSAAMHETQFNLLGDNQGMIYTNINYWISKKILDKKYVHLLEIQEQSLLNKLQKDIIRLRKYFRLQETLNTAIEQFIHTQRISKLKVKTMFEDFDYVLETLWSIKIYPQFINKNSVRFYFQYLKEDKYNFVLNSPAIKVKRKQHVIVQNIVWLIAANMVIQDQKIVDHQQNDKTQNNKDKLIQKVFTQKFKLIIKSITNKSDINTNNDNNDNQNIDQNLSNQQVTDQ